MAVPSKTDVLRLQRSFFRTVGLCIGVIVLVHAWPKNPAPHDALRLLCTIGFFVAPIVLCLEMLGPRRLYLEKFYAWRFEDAPPSIERSWQRYLYSFNQAITVFCTIVLVFFAATAVAVLSLWYPPLQLLRIAADPFWWISLLALALYPFMGGFMFHEVAQRSRSLNEEIALSTTFKPRNPRDLHTLASAPEAQSLSIYDDMRFRGGGWDWRWDDFYKNCLVLGQPGSGKTVCVLNTLLEGLLASARESGIAPSALILDPKGDFAGKIRALCIRHGRGDDLLVIDPHAARQSVRWNPLDSDDDELQLADRFGAVLETLGMKGGDTSFWIDSAKKFIRHAVCLVRLTNPPGSPPTFGDIQDLAMGFHGIVDRTNRLDVTNPRCDQCLSFFANEWADLADETRTSVQAHITNMIDPFLMEPYATMFSGRSACPIPEVVDQGKILYVHMPIADKEAMARAVGTFVKLEYYREVLKRPDKPRPSLFFCDEFQVFFTSSQGTGDAEFFERSRQSNHANVIATQNLPSLLRYAPKKEAVMNFLGNCVVKVFLRNTDKETNEYASQLFGQHLVAMSGAQGASGGGKFRSFGQSSSSTDQYDQVVRPEKFASLAIPSSQGVPYCESIVHLASRSDAAQALQKLRWKVHPIQG